MFVSVYLVLPFLLFEWFFCYLCYLLFVLRSRCHLYLLNATWLDLTCANSSRHRLWKTKKPRWRQNDTLPRISTSMFDFRHGVSYWCFIVAIALKYAVLSQGLGTDRGTDGRTDEQADGCADRLRSTYATMDTFRQTSTNWWSTCRQQNSPSVTAHLPRRNVNNPCCPIARLWLCE